jgi:hypothetical protein
MSRRIIFSARCDEAASAIGGYESIDCSLDAFWGGLQNDPHGFLSIKTQLYSAKFIVTKPLKNVPPLVWIFTISTNGDVILDHVEIYENY